MWALALLDTVFSAAGFWLDDGEIAQVEVAARVLFPAWRMLYEEARREKEAAGAVPSVRTLLAAFRDLSREAHGRVLDTVGHDNIRAEVECDGWQEFRRWLARKRRGLWERFDHQSMRIMVALNACYEQLTIPAITHKRESERLADVDQETTSVGTLFPHRGAHHAPVEVNPVTP